MSKCDMKPNALASAALTAASHTCTRTTQTRDRDVHLSDVVLMGQDYYEDEPRGTRQQALGPDFPPMGVGNNTIVRYVRLSTRSIARS